MKVSIKWALIGGFIGLQVISISIIIVFSYLSSEKVLLGHAKDIMENIATYTIHEAQSYLKPAQDAARLTQRLADSNVVGNQNLDELESYFYEQLVLHPNFAGIYMGSPNGEFLYVSRIHQKVADGFRTKSIILKDGIKTTELKWKDKFQKEFEREHDAHDTYDPTRRPWYLRARQKRQTIWTAPYIFFTSKQPGITTASPILKSDGGLAGVVGVDIEIGAISTFLARLKVGKNGRAFILNKNGDVVAFPDLSKIKHPVDDGQGALRLKKISELDDILSRKAFGSLNRPAENFDIDRPIFGSFSLKHKKYHTMFAPFSNPQWPWVIGIYLPEDDYLGAIKQNRRFSIYLMSAIAALASILGYLIARSIVKPMLAFRSEAEAIKDYDLETTFDKNSVIREIQATADSFTQMKAGLEAYRRKNANLTQGLKAYAEELSQKEVRLRASLTSLVNFSDALIVLDEHHVIRFVNPAAESLLGAKSEAILGEPFMFSVDSKKTTEIRIDAHSQKPVIAEMRVVDTEWDGQMAVLVALRDITEKKQMVDEIKWRADKLAALHEQAQRDAKTKAVLLKEINHRVKNNLSAIIGLLYVEQRRPATKDNTLFHATIKDLIHRMQGLATVHSLLSASEWRPLLISEMAEEIISATLQALPIYKNLDAQVSPSPVRVDAGQAHHLAMVINEMITNTVKYALQKRKDGKILVDISLLDKDKMVCFTFRDDGPGFPEDVLRSKRYHTGLYLIENIVRRDLRGELEFHNDGGAVTMIKFNLADPFKEDFHDQKI